MTSSTFTRFIKSVAADWSARYGRPTKLKNSARDARIPKASTFDFGKSAKDGKFVLLNFQASPKPWEVGCFTINVNISQQPYVVTRTVPFGREAFAGIEDGYYRLALVAGFKDTWWRLQPGEAVSDDPGTLTTYWEATQYSSESQVFKECIASVNGLVEQCLIRPLGLLGFEENEL